jgi:hypothetical protein
MNVALAVILGWCVSLGVTFAQERCPETITVDSQVQSVPPGWQPMSRPVVNMGRHPLEAVAFTRGFPGDGVFLRPTSSRKGLENGERLDIYEFEPAGDDIWLVCMYRETRQMLAKPVDASICSVTRTERLDKPVKSISCR